MPLGDVDATPNVLEENPSSASLRRCPYRHHSRALVKQWSAERTRQLVRRTRPQAQRLRRPHRMRDRVLFRGMMPKHSNNYFGDRRSPIRKVAAPWTLAEEGVMSARLLELSNGFMVS